MLKKFTEIFVQDDHSLALLQKIKINTVSVAHDTRFDRVSELAASHIENDIIKNFSHGFNIFVAGSTWPADERRIAAAFYNNLVYNNFKLIVAPHNIDAKHMKQTTRRFKKFSLLYSSSSNTDAETLTKKRVLIIDNIGMLAGLYKYADVCYVGGGFNKGVHNTLEAAVYAKPVFVGPRYKQSGETESLVKLGSAFSISTSDDIVHKIEFMGNFEKLYNGICVNAGKYVSDRCGGTEKILEKIKSVM